MTAKQNTHPDVVISDDEVHLWFSFPEQIGDAGLLASYMDILSPEEQARRQRYHFEKHRHLFLVSRALLRTTLSRYTGIPSGQLQFSKNKYGRPEISSDRVITPVRFNLSHTEGLIALAVTLNDDIGVDVEHIIRKNSMMNLANHFFSRREAADLLQVEEGSRQERFFDYWTLKESYIKARGMGLSLPLDQFSFHLSDQAPIQISFNKDIDDASDDWQFWLMKPTAHHTAAVSLRKNKKRRVTLSVNKVVPLALMPSTSFV